MYIAELDRTWQRSSCASHGFLVTLPAQIEALQHSFDYVYVDSTRSDPETRLQLARGQPSRQALTHRRQNGALLALDEARDSLIAASTLINRTIHEARRSGRIELKSVYAGLVAFVDCTLKNVDGMQWLIATEPTRGFSIDAHLAHQ